ncbi:MAG TPA: hypothetical protein PKZ84_14385 [Anaerolineae bacterium]|nr:hypothetical protein [Anaerolineae bacterium]HQI85938.1 hypothetical protein [Anaerolineae bacterium]
MAINIVIFLFIGLLWGLLYYFPLRRAATQADFKPLRYFLIAFGVVFLGNAFLAFLGARSLWAAATLPAVTSVGAFGNVADGAPVILDGIVSMDNPLLTANYAAYTACEDEESCTLRSIPENLRVTVDDGDVTLANNDFSRVGWPAANNPPEPLYAANFLAPGEPVIVVGRKETTRTMWAEIVYVGTHRAFVSRARRRLIAPVLLTLLNLVGAASVAVFSLRRWRAVKP